LETHSARTNLSKLMIQDINRIVHISGELRCANKQETVISLLSEIEVLLGIYGIMCGICERYSKSVLFFVSTCRDQQFIEHLFESSNQESFPSNKIFRQEVVNESLLSFLYLEGFECSINKYQNEILQILIPQLHSTNVRLHDISKQFTSLALTTRELEVIHLVGIGKDNWSISQILGVSERTIKFHCNNIFKKFGVNSKLEAIGVYYTRVQPYKSLHQSCH